MIQVFKDLLQGTDEWFEARRGLLTASEMKHIITPAKLKYSDSEKEKTHLYELLAQRITGYVEPSFVSDDMLRGQEDESYARETYSDHFAPVETVGFVTNDKWGFTLGYSPDGLTVDGEGQIECKSRRQKFQVEVIINGQVPQEHVIQVQTGLLVTERKWCDYVSYCGGLPMKPIRVEADDKVQEAILAAATTFHERMDALLKVYAEKLADPESRLIPTERREREITV